MSSEPTSSRVWPGALTWAGLLAAALLLCYPLWLNRPNLPWGSDVAFTSQSAHAFVQGLRDGVLYPRWVDDSNRGFGAPTFIFYPPLAYYAVGLGAFVSGDVIAGMRLVFILAAFLSGLSFYVSFRGESSELGAGLGAILYMLAPYHVLDFYWRFAFAEYVAFIWFPLLFLFVRRLIERPTWGGGAGLAAIYAGLLLTHLVTAYMVLVVLAPYALIRLAVSRRWVHLAPLAGAGLLALLCAAVYLVPMLVQRDQVHLEWIRESHYGDYQRNFTYRNEVEFGYDIAPIKPLVNRSASTQGGLALAAALVLGWQLLRDRRRRSRPKGAASRVESVAQASLCVWTFFLQIPLSAPLWRFVPELATVQFPWRFGAFQALVACALVACVLRLEPDERTGAASRAILRLWAPLGLVLLAALPMLVVSHDVRGRRTLSFGYAKASHPVVRTRVMYEYIPVGVEPWREFEKVHLALGRREARARLLGRGEVRIQRWATHSRSVEVSALSPTQLQLRTFAFSGWRARVDGEPVPVHAGSRLGAIQIDVPSGTHTIEVEFGSTPDRVVGVLLSVLGFVGLAGAAFLGSRRPSRPGD